jgi:hypothetical protein
MCVISWIARRPHQAVQPHYRTAPVLCDEHGPSNPYDTHVLRNVIGRAQEDQQP